MAHELEDAAGRCKHLEKENKAKMAESALLCQTFITSGVAPAAGLAPSGASRT